ncbi:hypothetical protein AB0N79_39415 [Streptomyces microflavus]|uniref:hypothetical protein n=1 Tax=Streptomyces microflavus TaxID=1919 RepID=UPI003446B0C3
MEQLMGLVGPLPRPLVADPEHRFAAGIDLQQRLGEWLAGCGVGDVVQREEHTGRMVPVEALDPARGTALVVDPKQGGHVDGADSADAFIPPGKEPGHD